MDQTTKPHVRPNRPFVRKLLRQFGRDEDGSMIVFSLFLIVVMLILGGMSVDFMRFESRRAMLQGVADRAALAAANLQNTKNANDVVVDYFAKAGLSEYLDGDPIVLQNANYRSVQVNAKMDLNTYFLKLVDIDQLQASGVSRAVEGVGEVEISLVLDISGSMGFETLNADGSGTGETKMQKLREAATAFVTTVLAPEYQDKISVSLIPYSQHVNAGPTLFNRLSTVHRHDFSHCIEFPDTEFSTTALNTSLIYEQGQNVQFNPLIVSGKYSNDTTEPVCPRYWFERITHVSQNIGVLTNQIAALEPRAGTSIFLGLKWGVALLDPSMRSVIAAGLDSAFTGRPVAYATPTSPNRTEKVIVLMTDGENQWSDYMRPEYYDTPSEYAHWNDFNWPYYRYNHLNSGSSVNATWSYTRYTAPGYPGFGTGTDGDVLLDNLCTAAKAQGITIFTIAFEATTHGAETMAKCASSPSHFFNSSGGELKAIFEAIAGQITELRLTQ